MMKRCPRAPSKPKLKKVKTSDDFIGTQVVGVRNEANTKPINDVYKKFVVAASSLLKYFVAIK